MGPRYVCGMIHSMLMLIEAVPLFSISFTFRFKAVSALRCSRDTVLCSRLAGVKGPMFFLACPAPKCPRPEGFRSLLSFKLA